LALRGVLKEMTAVGREADAALAALVKASDRLRNVTNTIHSYGVNNPSHEQIAITRPSRSPASTRTRASPRRCDVSGSRIPRPP
jgi:hypothetical protein